jgi:FMN phosphatase YigB (HAD superfamily)
MQKKYIKLLAILIISIMTVKNSYSTSYQTYIARYFYGIQPQVVIFDINGVILDANGKLIPQCAALLQKCAHAGHTIMILSNCESSTIGLLFMQHYDDIIKYIKPEHILISEVTNTIKPFDDAYKLACDIITNDPNHLGKNPKIFFIDDTKINVIAAQKNGLYGLHLNDQNYNDIEHKLRLLRVLP